MESSARAWLWPEPTLAGVADVADKRIKGPIGGFIVLEYTEENDLFKSPGLSIELVQRPLHWPASKSFCSSMLPAAIVDMFEAHDLSVEKLARLVVIIDAHPYKTACKCYVRTMASMGFTHARDPVGLPRPDSVPIPPIEAVSSFCKSRRWISIHAWIEDPEVHAHLPIVDAKDRAALRTALIIDTFSSTE